ncbi:histidine kinase [Tenacibaculum sp. nBUS_03]|uniref:histidine kinase n=1 Tax=Tenacibaculum sp. nBUS_03 TaxID=3395320 RepID=UPI003EBC1103
MEKILYIIILLVFSACYHTKNDSTYTITDVSKTLFKIGDNALWSKQGFDDSDWTSQKKIPENDEIFWARKKVNITKSPDSLQVIGLSIHSFGAYEVYWDGYFIGRNGIPGKEFKREKTGTTNESFIIPNNLLTEGSHTIALRMSQLYEKKDTRNIYTYIVDYKYLITYKLKDTIYINILAGAFLLTCIYYFFLFINDKKQYTMLLFSLSSLLFFLLIIMEYIKFYVPIHYSNFVLRLKVIGILTLLISFLVPYYFSIQFPFKHRKKLIVMYVIFLLLIYNFYSHSFDLTALFLSQTMWLSSTIIISYAIYKKQKSAIIILIGLILSFIIYKVSIYDVSLFVSFSIISLCMFYLLSLKLKEQRLAFEYSIAESTRLKYELLKKNIQPHFLMNTLTSLIDWVEESPEKSVKFIEALAEEFDVLIQIENEKLIPISQEIKLCKSHLNIMKYRKEVDYIWKDEGVLDDTTQTIPPAVIHTLLENGITHCSPLNNNTMTFKLSVKATNENLIYTFITYGEVRNKIKNNTGGTGFKYVKARLTESYGDSWVFTSNSIENGWKNVIQINKP